jgi:hypothetical protein
VDRIQNYSASAVLFYEHISISLDVVVLRHLGADDKRVELAYRTESNVVTRIRRPPIRETAIVYRASILVHNKSRCALVIVTDVVVVTVTHIVETDALFSKSGGNKRVEIAEKRASVSTI